jgi:hypothetical protein
MDLVEVMGFQVPGLKFKERSKNLRTWDSRKDREVREGTELKLRNTLKEKNRREICEIRERRRKSQVQSLAATRRSGGRKMRAKRSTQGAGNTG